MVHLGARLGQIIDFFYCCTPVSKTRIYFIDIVHKWVQMLLVVEMLDFIHLVNKNNLRLH